MYANDNIKNGCVADIAVTHQNVGSKNRHTSVLAELGRQFVELVVKESQAYQIDEQSLGLDDENLEQLNEAQDGIAELTSNILRITPQTRADWAVHSRVTAYWHGDLATQISENIDGIHHVKNR